MNNNDGIVGAPLPPAVAGAVEAVMKRFEGLGGAREGLIAAYRRIAEAFKTGGILYICGNGGSFADAVHIKGELAKSFEMERPIGDTEVIERLKESELGRRLLGKLEGGLPVVVLGESDSLRSAYENDRDPALAYAQELNSFVGHIRCGVLLGISTGGNAANVMAAMTLARAYGLGTVSFTGAGGGKLAALAEVDWRVPGNTPPDVQENQVPLYHALCRMLEVHFFGQ